MNRRDFLSSSAAACLLPVLPAIPDLRPIRVYEFEGGYWWVAARCPEDAVRVYNHDCGGGEPWSVCLLDDDELRGLDFRREDGTSVTFADELRRLIDAGEAVPVTFAASSYYGA